jgi:multisubunit Na+/H+ antiporter MnhF subunit
VNAFTIAATVLIALLVPLGVLAATRRPIDGLIALELGSTLSVLALVCLAEGFHRSFEFGVAIAAAVSAWIGGLVYTRFLGRWL